MTPNAVIVRTVVQEYTVSGTVEAFDSIAFAEALAAAANVAPSRVVVTVAPASVRVTATITAESAAQSQSVTTALALVAAAPPAAASALLGVQVVSVDPPTPTIEVIAEQGGSSTNIAPIAAGAAGGGVLLLVLLYFGLKRRGGGAKGSSTQMNVEMVHGASSNAPPPMPSYERPYQSGLPGRDGIGQTGAGPSSSYASAASQLPPRPEGATPLLSVSCHRLVALPTAAVTARPRGRSAPLALLLAAGSYTRHTPRPTRTD